MAAAPPTIPLPIKADTALFVRQLDAIARHAKALADELRALDAADVCGVTTSVLGRLIEPCVRDTGHPGGHRNSQGTEWRDRADEIAAERARRLTTHYAKSSKGDTLCGADYSGSIGIAALMVDTTCLDCLAILGTTAGA